MNKIKLLKNKFNNKKYIEKRIKKEYRRYLKSLLNCRDDFIFTNKTNEKISTELFKIYKKINSYVLKIACNYYGQKNNTHLLRQYFLLKEARKISNNFRCLKKYNKVLIEIYNNEQNNQNSSLFYVKKITDEQYNYSKTLLFNFQLKKTLKSKTSKKINKLKI